MDLSEALRDKFTLDELRELQREIEVLGEHERAKAAEEAYKRQFAVMMRVLRDRFALGSTRLHRLWNACLEYVHDIDAGHMTTQEMLDCLEHEDGICITWHVRVEDST